MPLNPDDHRLSMRISPRSRNPEPVGLRSLLVHRLTSTVKAVLRRPLRGGEFGLYCEPCDKWIHTPEAPESVCCQTCNRVYRVELVIYEEVQ